MKKEFLCYFILLTIILFGFGLKTEAQEEVATIQGTVVDSKGNSIKDAIVTTKPQTSQVVTQADGSYRIPSVFAGAYQIIAKTPDNRVGTTKIYLEVS